MMKSSDKSTTGGNLNSTRDYHYYRSWRSGVERRRAPVALVAIALHRCCRSSLVARRLVEMKVHFEKQVLPIG